MNSVIIILPFKLSLNNYVVEQFMNTYISKFLQVTYKVKLTIQSNTNTDRYHILVKQVSCADPEGGGGTGGPDPPEKSQKYRVS